MTGKHQLESAREKTHHVDGAKKKPHPEIRRVRHPKKTPMRETGAWGTLTPREKAQN